MLFTANKLLKNSTNQRAAAFYRTTLVALLNDDAGGSSKKKAVDVYKATLNLPNPGKFELSMKNICKNEKEISKQAAFESLYEWQEKNREISQSKPLFILHDGPPYSNGDIHMGHMVNKVLKDIILRYKVLSGHRVNYVPGWDCHGLPIELNVLKLLNKNKQQKKQQEGTKNEEKSQSTAADRIRTNADKYAEEFIKKQMQSFKEMNLMVNWNQIYKTKNVDYMCSQLDIFMSLYEKGLIYRDYMPVYWSPWSNTALAEFELEYNEHHVSNAFYVAYKLEGGVESNNYYALIWTTTPWSLPFNKAIAFNKNLKYSLIKKNERVYLVADELTAQTINAVPLLNDATIVKSSVNADELFTNETEYLNPFSTCENDRRLKFYHGDHVSCKQGTGLVHTAPSLGQDDFKLAIKHHLSTECLIDERGYFNNSSSSSSSSSSNSLLDKYGLKGLFALDKATTFEKIRKILNNSSSSSGDQLLLHEYEHTHSYPYDWRSKKPVIIRSSMQWFIDTSKLKERSLQSLESIRIRPTNVSNSMLTTLNSRPYWCISRQRVWGLPIPCLLSSERQEQQKSSSSNSSEPIVNRALTEKVKSLIRKTGSANFWWTGEHDSALLAIADDERSKNKTVVKSNDIFDIWFDSGCSFNNLKSYLPDPNQTVDLYCEGVDQFSGWFQSSLLLSVAFNNQAPYKNLLVHGFVVDEESRKMSKSIGNVIEPKQAIYGDQKLKLPQCGLDVLRFWVAHDYYKPQIQIGSNILNKHLKRVFEMRSILRFLVSNLNDLSTEERLLKSFDDLYPIDKYLLMSVKKLKTQVVNSYEEMNLNRALMQLESFLLTETSSFYIKSVRDRLYCDSKESRERLSAQTAIYHSLTNILPLLAPIMPHLAEEAFHYSTIFNNNHPNPNHSLFRSDKYGFISSRTNEFMLEQIKPSAAVSIEQLFMCLFDLRERFFNQMSKTSNNNPAVYEIQLSLSESDFSLITNAASNHQHQDLNWLIECFGCADLKFRLNESNKSKTELTCSLRVTTTSTPNDDGDINKHSSCIRCRKYNSSIEGSLCNRCKSVLASIQKSSSSSSSSH